MNPGEMHETAREPHHVRLSSAILGMDSIEMRLRRLLSRIEEGDQRSLKEANSESIPHQTESLCKVLHEGAALINKNVQTVHELLDQLESDLF